MRGLDVVRGITFTVDDKSATLCHRVALIMTTTASLITHIMQLPKVRRFDIAMTSFDRPCSLGA